MKDKTSPQKKIVTKKIAKKAVVKKKVVAPKVATSKAPTKKTTSKKVATKKVAKKVVAKKPVKQAVVDVEEQVVVKKNKLPIKDKRAFIAMLQGLKERHVGQISTLKKDSLSRNEPANTEDDGTATFDRQFALGLVSSERESLFEIEDALGRLENNTYGVCEDCSKLINRPRLQALPFVRMCIECQSQKERGKARFIPIFK